ncbi:MAG: hypothetical protein GTN99_01685, partial [Candidatus Dadabacteria bacterium]|nr:hypothetical protein [Candidatus Dadabacteria bacterium]
EYTDPVIKNNERTVMNRVFNREVFKTAAQIISSDQRLINLALNSSKNVYVSYVRYDSAGRAVTPSSILEDFGVIGTGDNVDITAFSDFGTDGLSIDDSNYYFIQNGIRSELKRYKRFSGLQQCEGLVNGNDFLKSLNTFSVTELEAYGICPYRYFASEILKLKYPSEPEDEPIPVDQGSVYHKILNLLFKELADIYGNKLDLREITDDELLKILNLIYESAEIEQEFGWLSDIKRTLNIKSITDKFLPAFVIQEALRIRRNNDKGFFPAEFEKKLSLKIDDATIEGKADRIDMSENAAIVIDYKLRGLSGRKFCDYKDLQLPLYLNCLAAKNIERHGAYYRSTERPDDEVGMDQDKKDFGHYLELSLQFVRSYIDNIRSGIFPPCPQKKDIEFFQQTFEVAKRKDNPCSYCEYSDLCRAYNTVYRTMED